LPNQVIAVAVGGVTDVVEHGQKGLLVSPVDLGQLLQPLERLLTDVSLRVEPGQRGCENVRAKCGFEGFRSELEDLLRDCGLASDRTQ
jgi:hypothetical protein